MINFKFDTYKRLTLVLLVLALSGCGVRYPMNIPEEQWLSMSAQQQFDARKQQAALDKATQERRAAEARAKEALALQQAAAIKHLRNTANFGDRVQCVLDPVEGYFRGRWKPVRPVALDLVSGYQHKIELDDGRGRYSRTLNATFDGQAVRLCGDTYYNECAEMLATQQQLKKGVQRMIDQEGVLRGQIYCDLVHQMPPEQRLRGR